MELPDEAKGHLVGMWMLAADRDGVLSNCSRTIMKLCQFENEPDLNLLISLGFFDAKATPRRRQLDAPKSKSESKAETPLLKTPSEPVARKRGTRLAEDWWPNEQEIQFAVREHYLTNMEWSDQARRFRDYWIGVSGQRGVKVNWTSTWKNWIRKWRDENPHLKKGNGHAHVGVL